MIKRWLLARRSFDAPLIALAIALLAIGNPIAKGAFLFFGLIGANLGFARHRTWRYADTAFCAAIIAYASWSIGLMVFRNESVDGNRMFSYSLIMLGFVFLPLSISLVREPLDALILGSRAAILAVLALIPFDPMVIGGRIDLGGNAAIVAFLAATAGLAARLDARRPASLLPNSRLWFYLSFVPVLLSGTRAAWFVYLLVALFDGLELIRHWRKIPFRLRSLALPTAAVLIVAAVPASSIVSQRISAGMVELEQMNGSGAAIGSMDVRLVMWAGAFDVVSKSPIVGVGGMERMDAVAAAVAPANAPYVAHFTHLHNLFVDEAASNGLVGLALLMSIFAVFLVRVTRCSPGHLVPETSYAFVFLVVTFGSFHGVLLNEWMILSIFSFMTLILVAIRRDAFRARYRSGLSGAGG
ncbi:O-antigen ligase family protein [Aurantimonas sp. C2-6-R+9]|uniref:O-antigen ligase family protein n=1 Tax=unclassified Aurantimonas TaxID=2638230 RepID=UPI002E16C8BF|nr:MULTISPECIES: O-antigen ligase family protein [unclassified Aurantimonas]MEC5289136.1 O-antigen ligase family protein [Aurantimonas sp. C2-3-R2]MEC5379289.1 O-antigen ligase family protein [Aurantimonas sp. C2-6-R+9]MEC5410042.1 O-antigen ligase family protein [Aurantimonas sp. C2-4-R8]